MKNKTLTIITIVVFSILTILLSIFLGYVLANKNTLNKFSIGHKFSDEKIIDKTYEELFDKIEINSSASEIEIKENTKDEIKVVVYGNKDKIKIEDINNELKIISEHKPCKFFCINAKIAKIEVYLPNSYDKNITITNKFGDIIIDEFDLMDANITSDAGDIKIESLKNVKIKSHLGDVIITNKVELADIESDCGDIKVNEAQNMFAKNHLGDIKVTKINNKLDLEDNCGDIKIQELYINEDSSIKNNLGDVKINNTNQIYIDATTSLGEVKVNNNYRKSDITLKIKNDCGDINVRN